MDQDTFLPDENQPMMRPAEGETAQSLLARREGVFWFKDVAAILGLSSAALKAEVKRIKDQGRDPWQVIGARKQWDRWIVRMKAFAPYYSERLRPKWRPLSPDWDGNRLLAERGIFRMGDVARRLPVTSSQLRHQARRRRSPEDIGIWKDADLNIYLLDMARFAPWFTAIWTNPDRDVSAQT